MYIRITPLHLSVSSIEASKRTVGQIDVAEFSFHVRTAFGNEYFFHYQLDERGIPGWHMYHPGNGRDTLATKAVNRNSLGRLNVVFTDKELDTLVRRINEQPVLTTYLVAPGFKDAINRPDFIVFPMNKKTIAFLRTFDSASDHLMKSHIADTMSQILADARQFHLSSEHKAQFLNDIGSELGIVNTNLKMNGYHMFSSHTTPPFIIEAIRTNDVQTENLRFEKNTQAHALQVDGVILDDENMTVGIIRDVSSILEAFEAETQQFKRMQDSQNTPEPYRDRGSLRKGNMMSEDIFKTLKAGLDTKNN